MNKKLKVLSLFDGISCARVAIERAGFEMERYYSSEIDKYAIQIAQKNFPDTIQVGSVVDLKGEDFKDIDLIIGGSPCQDLSIAGKRKGLCGERSGLFWEYVRIRDEVKPKYFILENVNSMSKEAKATITEALGVEPVMINASLVSAQNRKRLFWVGKLVGDTYQKVEISQPEDSGILLKDILEDDVDDKYFVKLSDRYGLKGLVYEKSKALTSSMYKGYGNDGVSIFAINPYSKQILENKSRALNTVCHSPTTKNATVLFSENKYRKLTPIECERLQGLPDNYTEGVSNTQRYKTLGNAFNVDVVAHIIKNL